MRIALALFAFTTFLQPQSLQSGNQLTVNRYARPSTRDMFPRDAALQFFDTGHLSSSVSVPAPIPASFQAHYIYIGDQAQSVLLAADGQGNVFILSTNVGVSGSDQIVATKADGTGKILASFIFDAGCRIPLTAAVDPAGNLIVAGGTCTPNGRAAFVLKLDPQLTKIVATAELAGNMSTDSDTSANALCIDSRGNVYLAGRTSAQDFPVTEGAFQSKLAGSSSAFLAEFSSDLKTILFASYLGGSKAVCPPGPPERCPFPPIAYTEIKAIAVDSTGSVVAAGGTTAIDFPITPGSYSTQSQSSAFVTKFAPGGAKLVWSTYLPLTQNPMGQSFIDPTAIGLDSAGNIVIGGQASDGLPVTSSVIQAHYLGTPAAFISKLDAAGQHLIFSTYFGGDSTGSSHVLQSLALDSSDGIWLTGLSDPSNLPQPVDTPSLGNTYIAALAPDGSSVRLLLTAPDGAADQGLAILPAGKVAVLGSQGSLLLSSATTRLSLMGVANAAGYKVWGVVAPTELVSLYGYNLGPSPPMQAQIVNGTVTTSLAGYRVLFNGIPAPLLYAGPNQVNAVVPSEMHGQEIASLEIVSPQGTSSPTDLVVRLSQPEVFSQIEKGGHWAAVLNEDQTINSANNPAAPGTVITAWATGADSACYPDGGITAGASGGAGLPVSVLWTPPILGGNPQERYSLDVLYAGAAPGDVCGVLQVNFRLADSFPIYTQGIGVQLQVGPAISQWVYIYVHP